MLGKSFGIIVVISLAFSLVTGGGSSLAAGVLEGAGRAVTVVISLTGMMCLWSGVMNVLFEAGVTRRLAKALSPVLSRLFPEAYSTGRAKEEIASALCANFLGIGNAATPLALSAMKKMGEGCGSRASDDMIMLTLTSTCPISLIPTTIITLRKNAGCADPFGILVPVWISSAATFTFCVTLALICRRIFRVRGRAAP